MEEVVDKLEDKIQLDSQWLLKSSTLCLEVVAENPQKTSQLLIKLEKRWIWMPFWPIVLLQNNRTDLKMPTESNQISQLVLLLSAKSQQSSHLTTLRLVESSVSKTSWPNSSKPKSLTWECSFLK